PAEGLGTPVGEVLAAIAAGAQPGPTAIAMLCTLDPGSLTGAEQVDLVIGLERQAAWLAAVQVRAIAAMGRPGDGQPPEGAAGRLPAEEWAAVELGIALRMPAASADRRMQIARELDRRLPATWQALARGQITYWAATVIVEACAALTDPAAARVEAQVLRRAGDQTVAELRRSLRRAVLAADPAAAQGAHQLAAAARRVDYWALPDGMAELRAVSTAEAILTVQTALTALADRPRADGDDRGIDARRADALVELCSAALDRPRLPVRHGRRPHIQFTVPAGALLGGDSPGELAGYGPITAPTARRIAASGTWRRLITDPASGRLLDYGRTTYSPPADLAGHIIARDRVCTFPHCAQPAQRCDIDHAVPWPAGGTDAGNCAALCRRHHRVKTHTAWSLNRPDQHSSIWTSPTGHTYPSHPPPYGPDP
ncbi:MAG: HNH endonuclease, partial [Actinomycetota bacterium]|nr:HNH endonuclease [Actinomycetota bacterium]